MALQGIQICSAQEEREQEAADRIRETPDARFARAMDRLQPLFHSYHTRGKTWNENGVRASQVRKLMTVIRDPSAELGELADHLIDDAIEQGFLSEQP